MIKRVVLVALIASLLLVLLGCVGQKDTKAEYLALIKTNFTKSYEIDSDYGLALDQTAISGSSHVWAKGNLRRTDLSLNTSGGFLPSTMSFSYFELKDGIYICSIHQLTNKTKCVEESALASSSSDSVSLDLEKVRDEATTTLMIDRGILKLPQKTEETKIAGRTCILFENMSYNFSDLSEVVNISKINPEILTLYESVRALGTDTFTHTACFDKETGIELRTVIEAEVTGGKFVLVTMAKEFKPDVTIPDSQFQLPAAVLKDCGYLEQIDERNQCFNEAVGGDASLCQHYDVERIACVKGVYGATKSQSICESLSDRFDKSECYEWLAEELNDSSLCNKSINFYKSYYCQTKQK
jgi:outer membrane lipoprotein-sorting protein